MMTFENQYGREVTIFINGGEMGTLASGEVRRLGVLAVPPRPERGPEKYLVEAKDAQGHVVYSEEFTWYQLNPDNA
jgi:hypothetical protein